MTNSDWRAGIAAAIALASVIVMILDHYWPFLPGHGP